MIKKTLPASRQSPPDIRRAFFVDAVVMISLTIALRPLDIVAASGRPRASPSSKGTTTIQHSRRALFSLCALLPLVVLTGGYAQAQTYTVVDIGKLPGTDYSYPTAINSKNTANIKVVGNTVVGSYKNHAFYWSTSTGLVRIGTLGTGTYSETLDVNSLGKTVMAVSASAASSTSVILAAILAEFQNEDFR